MAGRNEQMSLNRFFRFGAVSPSPGERHAGREHYRLGRVRPSLLESVYLTTIKTIERANVQKYH